MKCLKLLILALVQIWTLLRIPKWLLLLSLYEASREGEGGGALISITYRGGCGADNH